MALKTVLTGKNHACGCTHSDTVACEVAFANLREQMMLLKNRYLLVPPLSEAEAAELRVSKNTSRIDVPEPLGILPAILRLGTILCLKKLRFELNWGTKPLFASRVSD
ncbi:hypothetical protein FACS1894137_15060 [Spirochaetia bacterium]|nr:hypothetical protein FACS1894137_15060 [Spirochaetia bacterium]